MATNPQAAAAGSHLTDAATAGQRSDRRMIAETNFTGKAALVTGGSRGIGIAIVLGLARIGFTVLLGARSLDAGQAAARTLQGDVRPVVLDATSQEQVDAL
jgi:NADP-dependent 3-hydroxy acid dehydrogenase YdfG